MTDVCGRIKAVMLGHAVADALGVPVEFTTRAERRADPVSKMRGYGSFPVPAGSWSDDTTMALCALDVLKGGVDDAKLIFDNYLSWVEHGAFTPEGRLFDIGGACSTAIRAYGQSDRTRGEGFGGVGEYSNGNGSLMRIHPHSLFYYFNPYESKEERIAAASALTHAHPRSELGCIIFDRVLCALLDNPCKEAVEEALRIALTDYSTHCEIGHYSRLEDIDRLPEHEIFSTGYVVHSLEAAIWCLLNTDSYRDCVLKAVNLGEDTDTVGAIAGALAGALYGYGAIPEEWLAVLIKRDYIEEMCEAAALSWCGQGKGI